MSNTVIILFQVIILIFSAVVYEYMHGFVAERLGDPTARLAGRLSLNPIVHLEWFGSFLLPGLMLLSGMPFAFGWAKPVPYNPHNLIDKRWGEAKVALAGPLANLVVAIFFALFLKIVPFLSVNFTALIGLIIYINLILMIFNLLPIPPLDGSKILSAFLNPRARISYLRLERFGFIFVILFAWVAFPLLLPIIDYLFRILT